MATLSRSRSRSREPERQALLFPSPPKRAPGANAAAATETEGADAAADDDFSSSPYSLSKEDMDQMLTDEFDRLDQDDNEEELTTSGRTYEELVSASEGRAREDEGGGDPSSLNKRGRKSRKSLAFQPGRNSLSNWSSVLGDGGGGRSNDDDGDGDGGIPSSVRMEQVHTGRKSNVSRLSGRASAMSMDTPLLGLDHVNLSRSVHVNDSRGGSRGGRTRPSRPSRNAAASSRGAAGGRRSRSMNNLSHISSSSSSGMAEASGESSALLGESWSPIRTSLEDSFARSAAGGGSLSPIEGRASNSLSPNEHSPKNGMTNAKSATGTSLSPNKAYYENGKSTNGAERNGGPSPTGRKTDGLSPKELPARGRSKSPTRTRSLSPRKRSPTRSRSPVRSPLGDISPNRSPARAKSPAKGATSSSKRNEGTSAATSAATSSGKKALSPNGTFSLVEAEGVRLSSPNAGESAAKSPGSNGGSNMSVSSGSGASAELLARRPPETKKDSPRSSIRTEGPEGAALTTNQRDARKGPVAVREEREETTIRSPPKAHARSPAPTPNSRRRVIKRFRASIPAANYLAPEDLLEESLERNPMLERNPNRRAEMVEDSSEKNPSEKDGFIVDRARGTASAGDESGQPSKPMEVEESAGQPTAAQSVYENSFEFPSDSIPLPRTKTLRLFHDQAVSNGSPSHQYQLNRAGANLLSLQEVILPSVACETNAALKKQQAKAQRNAKDGMPDSRGRDVVEAIETCRRVVAKCTGKAMDAVGRAFRERETERERSRSENFEKEREEARVDALAAKKGRKEARARSRRERYERQKQEKRRNHPRNKELWLEVAKLMVDIQKLEKEERLWKEASVEVARLEEHHQPPEKVALDPIVENKEVDKLVNEVKDANLESTATTLADDVTMATEQINTILKRVSLAMEESDKLRSEAYDKYQYDGHKFYGYPQVNDSKGLFMALSMESPLRE